MTGTKCAQMPHLKKKDVGEKRCRLRDVGMSAAGERLFMAYIATATRHVFYGYNL